MFIDTQTKNLNSVQLKRWKVALKEAAKINRKLKKSNGIIFDSDGEFYRTKFTLRKYNNISSLGIAENNFFLSFGDNDPEMDNGVLYSKISDIKNKFSKIKVYAEIN